MRLRVHVEPTAGLPPDVDYRWDADTDILSVRVLSGAALPIEIALAVAQAESSQEPRAPSLAADTLLSGAVELEGRDGSWIVLDVEGGHLSGVEVAVWPNVRRLSGLLPPTVVEDARVRVAGQKVRGERRPPGAAALEVTTRLTAESDPSERTIHFRLGPPRDARAVRLGRDLLVDVDADDHLAGLWLLNVPPVPTLT